MLILLRLVLTEYNSSLKQTFDLDESSNVVIINLINTFLEFVKTFLEFVKLQNQDEI